MKKETDDNAEPQSIIDVESEQIKNESEEEYDSLFQNMEVVTEKKTKTKIKRKKTD